MRADHYECEFYEKWAFANVDSMKAKHCECEFYERWALQMWVLWELSILNVDFVRAEFANVTFMRAKHCECDFYESWSLWI